MGWHRHLLCLEAGYLLDIELSHESCVTGLSGEVSSYKSAMVPCWFSRWISTHRQMLLLCSGYTFLVVFSLALGGLLSHTGRSGGAKAPPQISGDLSLVRCSRYSKCLGLPEV